MRRKVRDAADNGCPARSVALGSLVGPNTWQLYQCCMLESECASADVLANGWPVQVREDFIQSSSCSNQAMACLPPM